MNSLWNYSHGIRALLDSQSEQRGHQDRNFGYAILGLKWYWIRALFYFMYFIGYKAL